MPRRPLLETVALSLRVPRGQDGYWAIITEVGAEGAVWTLADIDKRTNAKRSVVGEYVARLVKSGHVEIVATERDAIATRHLYRIARTSREAPRLRRDGTEYPETARDRMWRAMKMLDTWTWGELADATETETLKAVPPETVKSYCRRLHAADVLQMIDKGGPNRPAVYRLLRNIGAAAPRILRTHLIFDPNSNTVLGVTEAKEVA